MVKRNKIAIIPARGGSKRIPLKNIKSFLGKPIIAYSIEAALNSKLFDEVMVSTDSQEIKLIAEEFGAHVPFIRSAKNSNDVATTFDVIQEVLFQYESFGTEFSYGCCIYPTAPFVTPEILQQALSIMTEKGFDSILPVMRFSFPIQRALKLDEDRIELFNPEHLNTRSQDLIPAYHDAGQFYWFKIHEALQHKRIIGSNTGAIIIRDLGGQDIDNLEDWKLAELKYKTLMELSLGGSF